MWCRSNVPHCLLSRFFFSSSSAEQERQRDLQRSLMCGYVPLDYIVEASTMQSMGIYTCLKAWLVTTTQQTARSAVIRSKYHRSSLVKIFTRVLVLLTSAVRPHHVCPVSLCPLVRLPLLSPLSLPYVFLHSIFYSSLQGHIGIPGLFGLPGPNGERVSISGFGSECLQGWIIWLSTGQIDGIEIEFFFVYSRHTSPSHFYK